LHNKITLKDLKPGQIGIIKQFSDLEATCKLITMGLIPNVRVEVLRKAPFGGGLYVKLDNHNIGMRSSEAASVEIEIVQ
jgi:ferrous iron transport protein A